VQDDIYKVMCGATHADGVPGRGKERAETESDQRSS
jgi:hypothetical protein